MKFRLLIFNRDVPVIRPSSWAGERREAIELTGRGHEPLSAAAGSIESPVMELEQQGRGHRGVAVGPFGPSGAHRVVGQHVAIGLT